MRGFKPRASDCRAITADPKLRDCPRPVYDPQRSSAGGGLPGSARAPHSGTSPRRRLLAVSPASRPNTRAGAPRQPGSHGPPRRLPRPPSSPSSQLACGPPPAARRPRSAPTPVSRRARTAARSHRRLAAPAPRALIHPALPISGGRAGAWFSAWCWQPHAPRAAQRTHPQARHSRETPSGEGSGRARARDQTHRHTTCTRTYIHTCTRMQCMHTCNSSLAIKS